MSIAIAFLGALLVASAGIFGIEGALVETQLASSGGLAEAEEEAAEQPPMGV